jgi:hypothetical protein
MKTRAIIAWLTVGILAADLTREGLRVAACYTGGSPEVDLICQAPGAAATALWVKFQALTTVWSGVRDAGSPPVVSPGSQSGIESQIQRLQPAP